MVCCKSREWKFRDPSIDTGLLDETLAKHAGTKGSIITILQEAQGIYSYLPQDIMTYIAAALDISPSSVYGVATFYAHFTMEPKGKYIIKVCDGTACHVKKSGDLINYLQKELGLSDKAHTSEDMMFPLEAVACVGVCGLAPVILVNDDVYGAMTVDKTAELLKKIREDEENHKEAAGE